MGAGGGGERDGGSIAALAVVAGEGAALALVALASRAVLAVDACGIGPVVGSIGAERVVQLHANPSMNTVTPPSAHLREAQPTIAGQHA